MTLSSPTVPAKYASLLEPISQEHPCGTNLEYDPDFVLLQSAATSKTAAQYGDFIGTPEAINWADIERRCLALLLRTRDIRLIALLIRSRACQAGAQGLCDGFSLLQKLIERYPEQLHPVLITDGEPDPIMRANALASLSDHDGLLKDIRDLTLSRAAGLALQIRDVEKAYAIPRNKEAHTPESVDRLLQELTAKRDSGITALAQASDMAAAISTWATTTLQPDAPDLTGLNQLLRPFSHAPVADKTTVSPIAQAVAPVSEHPTPTQESHTAPEVVSQPEPGTGIAQNTEAQDPAISPEARPPMDRWAALAAIAGIRDWFEQNEPSSPVSVLLKQAERMVGKRFAELVDTIPPDLLKQWEMMDQDG